MFAVLDWLTCALPEQTLPQLHPLPCSRVQHDWQLSDRLQLQWGGDLRQTWFSADGRGLSPQRIAEA